EIQGGDDKKKLSRIEKVKRLVTAETVCVNEKFKPKYEVPNRANYIFLTNDPSPFLVRNDDRRLWIWEIQQDEPLAKEFYMQFHAWRNSAEGISALHHYLLNLDLEGFDPNAKAPMTKTKQDMIDLSRSDLEKWLHELPDNTKTTLYTTKDLLLQF